MTNEIKIVKDCLQRNKEFSALDLIEKLQKENEELKAQIEKLRCCGNCKHYGQICEKVDIESFTGNLCGKWEIAE